MQKVDANDSDVENCNKKFTVNDSVEKISTTNMQSVRVRCLKRVVNCVRGRCKKQ